jgi:hypothetical protein
MILDTSRVFPPVLCTDDNLVFLVVCVIHSLSIICHEAYSRFASGIAGRIKSDDALLSSRQITLSV